MRLVVTEFVTLDGVMEDPGGAEKSPNGGWAFRFERGPEGDKFKFDELLATDGIPFMSFAVQDVKGEFARLAGLGVRFTQEPLDLGPVTTAVFDDTCGNLIQIAQLH